MGLFCLRSAFWWCSKADGRTQFRRRSESRIASIVGSVHRHRPESPQSPHPRYCCCLVQVLLAGMTCQDASCSPLNKLPDPCTILDWAGSLLGGDYYPLYVWRSADHSHFRSECKSCWILHWSKRFGHFHELKFCVESWSTPFVAYSIQRPQFNRLFRASFCFQAHVHAYNLIGGWLQFCCFAEWGQAYHFAHYASIGAQTTQVEL